MKEMFVEAQEQKEFLVALRRELHQIPEIGMNLPLTMEVIEKQLKAMECNFEILSNGAGIIGEIGKGEKVVLLRSDMDALPIKEESGEPFASTNGYMHACGHDMHATILIGAIKLLKAREESLTGRVRFLFQSGEEVLQGAKEACSQGILKDVKAAFAMHVIPFVPVNVVAYGKLPMSASTVFSVKVKGKGGHSSEPKNCIDPIYPCIQVYEAFQSLMVKECAPSDEVVLGFGSIHAGEAANAIPEECVLQGTLRTYNNGKMVEMIERMETIIHAVASMNRVEITMEQKSSTLAVVCDEALMNTCVEQLHLNNPNVQFLNQFHVMGSEDFAYISNEVPSVYMALGAKVDDVAKPFEAHHPKVRFSEDALTLGSAMYAQAALIMLKHVEK